MKDLSVDLDALDRARIARTNGKNELSTRMRVATSATTAGALDAVVGRRSVTHDAAKHAARE